jgi:hypothetical protein
VIVLRNALRIVMKQRRLIRNEPYQNLGWRGLFQSNSSVEKLEYIAPIKNGDQTLVYPSDEDIEEGVVKWRSSLVG